MELDTLIQQLATDPEQIEFQNVIATIDENYVFTPTGFSNGEQVNLADQNNGSCKIFSFAALHKLSVDATLACFGAFYRDEVLQDPQGTNHQNIRQFMIHGWDGVRFDGQALKIR
ncbi:HopJ type III effector protein [Vibrio porteresiae]|uniref:HopJ type III effector protein n=1 Tax=Vibrio porteresiae DSM 19223 TaxID=1123496 RepID=A0ABZ0QI08_9VIBR|nr:HopJ type III effector protein [Vibrio porteresiae]WPC76121.1 HopJ type III effector protein [Vibrio porteresiae DSM 19223]